ncbi:P-loop containing nucleoside triphosphate hydrolase protein [Lactifluus volemus]|nr:P-loop containing nucleoside triphosphate hydrolase protein [Lactifluus volemus]
MTRASTNTWRKSLQGPAKWAAFEPRDGKVVEHRKLGVWDLYIERDKLLSYLPASLKIDVYVGMWNDTPYLWRTIRDICTISWPLLSLFLILTLAQSLLPSLSLWYSGQLLSIVETAVEKHTVDTRFLAQYFISIASEMVSQALNSRCRQFYSTRIFHAVARLDVPTWDDPAVAAHINGLFTDSHRTNTWDTTAVLWGVLREQQDGLLLALSSFSSDLLTYFDMSNTYLLGGAWAATTRNQDYIKIEGLKRLVHNPKHRKEFVAGGLSEYLTTEYRTLSDRVGRHATDFWTSYFDGWSDGAFRPIRLLNLPLSELPSGQQPSSIPVSLASLHLMKDASRMFMTSIRMVLQKSKTFSEQLSALRKLFEAGNIINKVVDGTTPYPENEQSLRYGISLEFRNVSFRYPGSEKYALRDVSFKVRPGQLCVILGPNGSGKSTIVKLLARIYDPTEGAILVDGQDIKTFRLADLRRAMAILFQDYTLFPLTIRDNIALGDPTHAHDNDAIERAAHLGGATEVISRLSEGFDAYLERPVRDQYSGLPDGTTTLFGRKVDNGYLRGIMDSPADISVSGGEMQRIAVARTFMRSSSSSSAEQKVGMLLFDEPSASLDPAAEHDLFSRLREMRGSKTLIFSTHRFGNLTRHADIILYLNDRVVLETGTHEELMKREGSDYARLWQIQAQAFL